MPDLTPLIQTADAVREYIDANLFDSVGLMMSGIDSHTDKAFDPSFLTPRKVPRRAAHDPWSYWTYEDSVMSMGLYLDALVLQYEVTGEATHLQRARRMWTMIERVYAASQVYGPGSFLRPYGGFLNMGKFMEPLGTDQAGPAFFGMYRYLQHVEGDEADNVRRVMLETLRWYERQGFRYFYYKAFVHGGMRSKCHSNSYYLPAIAWAATVEPDDPRWRGYLDIRLGLYERGEAKVQPDGGHPSFPWGSDLGILREVLGERFDAVFTHERLNEAREAVEKNLANYEQPAMAKRLCPESAEPGFRPHVREPDPATDPEWRTLLAFDYMYTRHQGRARPRHETHLLLGLASVGCEPETTTARAAELLALRSCVPTDFTAFLADDYDELPETVHHYARSVGVIMVGWYRDHWLLRRLTDSAPANW